MRVQSIEFFWGQVPVNCRFSYGRVEQFPVLLARAGAADHEGWGEVLGNPDAAFLDQARQIIGTPLGEVDPLIERIAGPGSWSMFEAVSMACHDLRARIDGGPLHRALGSLRRRTVPLMPCIFPRSIEHAAQSAACWAGQGFAYLKLKLLGDLEQDLATVGAVRRAAPHIRMLQGDANEGYALKDLLQPNGPLRSLRQAGLDVIEDPCPGSPEDYGRLRSPDHPLVMIDVMARSVAQLRAALEQRSVDIVNLHPCQQVTLTRALRKAQLCESCGVPVVIGGTGYAGIGSAAYQQLAGLVGIDGPCGELGGEMDHGMPRGLCARPAPRQGSIELSDGPGHGAAPNFDVLSEYLRSTLCLS